MIGFLQISAIILLLLNLISFWRLVKQTPKGWFAELDELGLSNAAMQGFYALSGVTLFYTLTLMNHVRPLTPLGIVIIAETLLFLIYLRRSDTSGLLARYYRNGIGLYISGVLQIVFLGLALWLMS